MEAPSLGFCSIIVNSSSSIPSPVYQCRKARWRNMAPNWPVMRRKSCVMAVVLAMNVAAILSPRGGTSQMADLTLFGMKSQHASPCLASAPAICSSTSRVESRPRKMAAAVAAAEQLVHQFANRRLTVALGGAGAQGRNAGHEEVQPPVGHHVGEQLAQVRVQLTRKPEAASDAGHRGRDQVVQVVEGGPGQPQRVHADVVQRLIVQAERFVRRLHHRAEGKHGVVRLHHHLGHLRRRDDAERVVDPAREDVLQVLQQQRAQPRTCATTNRVHQLKALQTVASLSHPPGALDNPVQQLGSFRVVSARPIVARTGLPGDEAIGREQPPMTATPEVVQGARLQVGEDGARDEVTAGSLIEVHVDTLQRQEVPVLELTARVEAVLLAQELARPWMSLPQIAERTSIRYAVRLAVPTAPLIPAAPH
uniref:Uncharacterized protein n=1 Tax=Anopheles atroparvus TaxID=41427 RepID=A0A182J9Y7_ANOAO